MILDEPTVGVDPIIRQSIWDHLVDITNTRKKTVIITTHYIEETRQAHVVSYFVISFDKKILKYSMKIFKNCFELVLYNV